MKRLTRRFYARSTLAVAEDLIGRTIYRDSDAGLVAGRIVEAEAYCGASDPASHAYRRETPRNSVMFGPPGHLYVYFTYGMHHCSNIVTERDGVAGAVLLRAVEPLEGIDLMKARRGLEDLRLLARGPARFCVAFGIGRDDNGTDVVDGDIWVSPRKRLIASVKTSIRIGLPQGSDEPWRFFEPGVWTSGPANPKPLIRRARGRS